VKRGKLIIGIAIALIVFLSACGGEKQTEEENPDVLTTLSDTDFYVIDVWNGFCEMSSYYHSGLSVTGEEMDAAFTLSELKKEVCENGPKFDEAVRNLPDRYSDTVEYWDYFYSEAQRLLVIVEDFGTERTEQSAALETYPLMQYRDALHSCLYDHIDEEYDRVS
jgi:hypothetical protein